MDKATRDLLIGKLPSAARTAMEQGNLDTAVDECMVSQMTPPQWLLDEWAFSVQQKLQAPWDVTAEMHLGQLRLSARKPGKSVPPWD